MGVVLEDGMARVKGAHWPTGGVLQFFAGLCGVGVDAGPSLHEVEHLFWQEQTTTIDSPNIHYVSRFVRGFPVPRDCVPMMRASACWPGKPAVRASHPNTLRQRTGLALGPAADAADAHGAQPAEVLSGAGPGAVPASGSQRTAAELPPRSGLRRRLRSGATG